VCLCADWCGTCRDYRRAFEQRARERDDAVHIWLDIEDDSDWLGEMDVETLPTLLVLHEDRPMFFGPVLPHMTWSTGRCARWGSTARPASRCRGAPGGGGAGDRATAPPLIRLPAIKARAPSQPTVESCVLSRVRLALLRMPRWRSR